MTVPVLNGRELGESEAFWQEALRGCSRMTRLSFPGQGPQLQDVTDKSWRRDGSSRKTVSSSEPILRDRGIGLDSLLVAAWTLLLNRMTGEEVVRFGLLLEGCTFPVAVETSDNSASMGFLRSIGERLAQYRAHATVSASQILEWSQPKSEEQLFESIVVCDSSDSSNRTVDYVESPILILAKETNTSEYLLEFRYATNFLSSDAAEGLMTRFAKVTSDLMSNRCAELGDYSVLTEEEGTRLMVAWNRTEVEFDQNECIHRQFEQQVSRTPDKQAVVFREQALTYEELNIRSARLAVYLQNHHDIGPDKVVAICMTPSLELMVALLAVLKAGGAYLPVDPGFPAERISFMLRDSRAAAILTEQKLKDAFHGGPTALIVVDNVREPEEPIKPLEAKVHSHNLAYLMFTSGSTGMPKGVMVEHRNVVNFFTGIDNLLGTDPGVWLAVTSVSFDISVLELLWTLTRGFTVVIQAAEDKLTTEGNYSTEAQLRRHHITHLQCTPTLARTLIRLPGTLSAMRSLRQLLLGGEPLPLSLANRLSKELLAEIYNMYGPTETTVWSTAFKLGGVEGDSIPIGRPIANTSIYILDQRQRMVPVGASGELYIGGQGVTRGYWNRPELTAERFISNPFSDNPQDRLYRTGDLARYRDDTTIEFLGRIDHQVKIRGFRIELGEIESVLGSHHGVQEIVVTSSETPMGHQQLVAYVVSTTRGRTHEKEILIYARQKLPDYMIPAALVYVDSLPVTPNGKVDRKALAALAPTRKFAEANHLGSSTDLETTISQVWRDALGIDTIGLNDNFFDLGANSLIVAEAAAALKGTCKFDVRLTDLFAYPSISALAAYLSRGSDSQNVALSGSKRGALRQKALLNSVRIRTGRMDLFE
jgi:amino acid adenylation domain-containing protein